MKKTAIWEGIAVFFSIKPEYVIQFFFHFVLRCFIQHVFGHGRWLQQIAREPFFVGLAARRVVETEKDKVVALCDGFADASFPSFDESAQGLFKFIHRLESVEVMVAEGRVTKV